MEQNETEIARFFDCCETSGRRKTNTRMSRKARRDLVAFLRETGLEGKTVLEVGCGPGDLTRELTRLGATRALGIDLAEKALDEARQRAAAENLNDRIEYRLGNGAKDALEHHDIVVLDKVICCYPDWRELVNNTSAAARQTYGFVIPRSQGLSAFVVRAFIAIERLVLKLKRCGFVPFVHDYSKIDSHLNQLDFRRTNVKMGLIWMTAIYTRG
ncbi:MAG: class I SAM-dependent methyltransferase [Actinomycetota bacterium]